MTTLAPVVNPANLPPLTFEQIQKMRSNFEIFFNECLGVKRLEVYHKTILKAFKLYDRICIAATHSVGKTWITARIALSFLTLYKNSKVITTAPTGRQVKKLLWGELRSAHKNAKRPLGGRLLQTELVINDEWYAMGFSPQKEAGEGQEQSGSSFQGFHANYVLIIFDEATGIPVDVWKMAEGLLTSGKIVKFLAIGNPTSRNSEFFKCFSSPEWYKIHLSCFDSPNMIENGFTDMQKLQAEIDELKVLSDHDRLMRIQSYKKPVPYLLSAQWVLSKALAWGVSHPLFLSKCLGQFPLEDDNALVQLADVEAAQRREVPVMPGMRRYVGVDVAREGDDKTVFDEIVGYCNTRKKKLIKKKNTEVAGELINFLKEKYANPVDYPTTILIDGTGVGGGVLDILRERQAEGLIPGEWDIVEIHNASTKMAGAITEKELKELQARFLNIKAQMYWQLADDIKGELQLLEDSELQAQLPTVQYFLNSKGQIQIESKEDYKDRTGMNSPDEADALALANFGRLHITKAGSVSALKLLTKPKDKPDPSSTVYKKIKPRFEH
jgi:hypothetical protein